MKRRDRANWRCLFLAKYRSSLAAAFEFGHLCAFFRTVRNSASTLRADTRAIPAQEKRNQQRQR